MPKASLYNAQGQAIGEVELSDRLFGAPGKTSVVHRTVVAQLAHLRQGTHDVKSRSEVRGGGRKPWAPKAHGTRPPRLDSRPALAQRRDRTRSHPARLQPHREQERATARLPYRALPIKRKTARCSWWTS
jgi:ribosomal protein L4